MLIAAFLFYLPYIFISVTQSCGDHVSAWLFSRPGMPNLLHATALFAAALSFWLAVDIVRPKSSRFPIWIRAAQCCLAGAMLLVAVTQSGMLRPYSSDGQAASFVLDEVVWRWFAPMDQLFIVEIHGDPADRTGNPQYPKFERPRQFESELMDLYAAPQPVRAHPARSDPQICRAERKLDILWTIALKLYQDELTRIQDKEELAPIRQLPEADTGPEPARSDG